MTRHDMTWLKNAWDNKIITPKTLKPTHKWRFANNLAMKTLESLLASGTDKGHTFRRFSSCGEYSWKCEGSLGRTTMLHVLISNKKWLHIHKFTHIRIYRNSTHICVFVCPCFFLGLSPWHVDVLSVLSASSLPICRDQFILILAWNIDPSVKTICNRFVYLPFVYLSSESSCLAMQLAS